jgi:hypothetical protein
MSSPMLPSDTQAADSFVDVRALVKKRIRLHAKRYQRGSLTIWKRKTRPNAWMFRYYTEENGCHVYKRKFVGTVIEFPKRKDAEKAIAQLRVEINEGAQSAPLNIEQLTAHYKNHELPRKGIRDERRLHRSA